jgi:hypothetical protein
MKNILVPCDFSFTAKQAYNFALQVAQRTNAQVHVVKAIDFPFSNESTYAGGQYVHDYELLKGLQDDARKSFGELHNQSGSSVKVYRLLLDDFAFLLKPIHSAIQ